MIAEVVINLTLKMTIHMWWLVVMIPVCVGDHCHSSQPEEDRLDRRARNKLILASVLCILFVIGEAVGE